MSYTTKHSPFFFLGESRMKIFSVVVLSLLRSDRQKDWSLFYYVIHTYIYLFEPIFYNTRSVLDNEVRASSHTYDPILKNIVI